MDRRPGGGAEQRLRAALAKSKGSRGRSRSRSPAPAAGPRRRLGAAQAAEARSQATSSAPTTDDPAEFKTYLERLMLSRKMSGVEVQELASVAQSAGAGGIERVARAGARGRRPGNIQRDILRNALQKCTDPEPYYAEVELSGGGGTCFAFS